MKKPKDQAVIKELLTVIEVLVKIVSALEIDNKNREHAKIIMMESFRLIKNEAEKE